MTVMLHPDELLEREPSELSPHERALVDAHLAECIACQLLTRSRRDFAMERLEFEAEIAPMASPQRLDAGPREEAPSDPRPYRAPRAPVRLRRSFLVVGIGLLSAGAAAATARWAVVEGLMTSVANPSATDSGNSHQHQPTGDRTRRRQPQPPATPPQSLNVTPRSLDVTPRPSDAPSEPLDARPVPHAADAKAQGRSMASRPHVPVQTTRRPQPSALATTRMPEASEESAASLFDRATHARTQGDYAKALALYRTLEARYPDSAEAQASRATAARLLLDTGRNAAALEDYDTYLAGARTPLTEEALLGRALAYQRLGRQRAEREAWEALLRNYPSSVHASRARARLAAIQGPVRE